MYDRLSDEKWHKLVQRLTSEDDAKRVHAALRLARSSADAERTRSALEPLLAHERASAVAAWVLERLPPQSRAA